MNTKNIIIIVAIVVAFVVCVARFNRTSQTITTRRDTINAIIDAS